MNFDRPFQAINFEMVDHSEAMPIKVINKFNVVPFPTLTPNFQGEHDQHVQGTSHIAVIILSCRVFLDLTKYSSI
jgi:hypothetical protein